MRHFFLTCYLIEERISNFRSNRHVRRGHFVLAIVLEYSRGLVEFLEIWWTIRINSSRSQTQQFHQQFVTQDIPLFQPIALNKFIISLISVRTSASASAGTAKKRQNTFFWGPIGQTTSYDVASEKTSAPLVYSPIQESSLLEFDVGNLRSTTHHISFATALLGHNLDYIIILRLACTWPSSIYLGVGFYFFVVIFAHVFIKFISSLCPYNLLKQGRLENRYNRPSLSSNITYLRSSKTSCKKDPHCIDWYSNSLYPR